MAKRYHLVNWHTVCLPKDCGGLGVLDLTTMNKILLCKWLCKLENTEGTWHQMLTRKYLHNQVLAQAEFGYGCSHFWQGLMVVNPIFQQQSERITNDGRSNYKVEATTKAESVHWPLRICLLSDA
jgi:hypothetical protein